MGNQSVAKKLTIDPEFKELIPPLTTDEYKQLEHNIVSVSNCREALIIWNGVLVDGHNRYSICTEHGIDFQIEEMQFDSRENVKLWIVQNQLGRRNLTEEQMTYYRGKQHEMEKGQRGGNHGNQHTAAKVQNATLPKTDNVAERLAKQHNVSPDTIKRDAKYAKAVDAIGEVSPVAKQKILSGESKVSKQDLAKLIKHPEDVPAMAEIIENGTYKKETREQGELQPQEKANKLQNEIINKISDIEKITDYLDNYAFDCEYDEETRYKLEWMLSENISRLNDLYDHIYSFKKQTISPIPPKSTEAESDTEQLPESIKLSRQMAAQEQKNSLGFHGAQGTTETAITEIDPPEELEKMFQGNTLEKPLSTLHLINSDIPRSNFYKSLEQDLGLCDNGKLLISYENYKIFMVEYDPDKHARTKARIAKIKKQMESA